MLRRLRDRRRDLGAAPAEPFAAAAAREPGRLRIGVTTTAPRSKRRSTRTASGPSATPRELLAELGHEVEEIEAPWGGQEVLEAFIMAFGTPISMGVFFGGMVTGREPSEELVEPLSWTIWKGSASAARSTTCSRARSSSAFSRGIVALWETTTWC